MSNGNERDDDPLFDFARLRAVREATSTNLGKLAQIAGLDPAKDFRFADLHGADWTGTDRDAFDLEGAVTGPAETHMLAEMERGALLDMARSGRQWKDRRDAALALLDAHPEDETLKEQLAILMLTDRSTQFVTALSEALDPLSIPALGPDHFGDTLRQHALTNGKRTNAIVRWIMMGGRPGTIPWKQQLDFSGKPIKDIAPLAGLTGLQILDLRNTQIVDIAPLAGLTGLQSLYLSSTQVVDIAPLAGLTELQTLDLINTQVADITPLTGLTGLQSLYLVSTHVEDISALAAATALEAVYLQGTRVRDLSPLHDLPALRKVMISKEMDRSGLAGREDVEIKVGLS